SSSAVLQIQVTPKPNPNISFSQGYGQNPCSYDEYTYTISYACQEIEFGEQNDLDIINLPSGAFNNCNLPNGLANWNTDEATYQWQVSFDGGVTWQNGPGPTATTAQWVFDPTYVDYPNVEGVYSFRLLVTWNGCTGESDV